MPYTGRDDGCDELLFPLDRLTMGWSISVTFVMGFISLGVFIFFLRRGAFEDIEDVKYQLFREEKENSKSGTGTHTGTDTKKS